MSIYKSRDLNLDGDAHRYDDYGSCWAALKLLYLHFRIILINYANKIQVR